MTVEYLFAPSFYLADRAARKRGWRPSGRTEWQWPFGVVEAIWAAVAVWRWRERSR
jgi:hypothetical protein